MSCMPRRAFRPSLSLLTITGLLLSALLAGGCATTADKVDHLNRTLYAYERSIRWAQFDAAYGYHAWEGEERPPSPDHLNNIKVTAYDVEKRNFDEDEMRTSQTVLIRYYNTDTSREKTLRVTQDWRYDEERKRWLLYSPPPAFE